MGQKQRKRRARQAVSKSNETRPDAAARLHVEGSPFTTPALLISLGIATVVAVVYSQVRHFEFVYLDDPVYVYENQRVLQGLSWEGVKWALTTQAAGNWHPLTWLSHMADVDLYGSNAGGHHVTSLAIHVLNSILLFAVFHRMTNGLGRSAIVAALFALHPLHVESVAWVAERKDVLSTLFWMLTIHAYASYTRHRGSMRYLLVALFFALGLMSKPMLVTLPFTLLLLDYWPLKRVAADRVASIRAWLPLVREKIPLFILTIISMVVTVKVQRGYGAVVRLEEMPVQMRVGNAIVSYVAYMQDLLWPKGLAAFYPFRQHSGAYIGFAAIILTACTAVAIWQGRRRPYILVGWAWYVGTLIPAIGLVQVGDQARADRYTYVPVIGLFIIAVWGVWEIASRARYAKPVLTGLSAIVVIACAALSMRQVKYWENNLSLFTRTTAVTTRNYRAEALLGVAYSAKGQHAEAIKHYRASLAIWDGNAEVHSNLGASLYALGNVDESLHQFSEAVRYKPESALFHYNYGVMLNEKGRTEEGLEHIRRALELDPSNKAFRDALDLIMSKQKR